MAQSGAFDGMGIPVGTYIRMSDLVDARDAIGAVDGDVLIYKNGQWIRHRAAAAGVQEHSALFGLDADDHPQYLTTARGDARYDAYGAATTYAGQRMRWRGSWPLMGPFSANDVVLDGPWLMVANTKTWDRPGPVLDGESRWRFNDDAVWEYRTATTRELILGQRYTMGPRKSLFLTGVRIMVNDGQQDPTADVRLWIVTDPTDANLVRWFELGRVSMATIGWAEVNVPSMLVPPGATFDIVATVVRSSGATSWTGQWLYTRPDVENASVSALVNDGGAVHPRHEPRHMTFSKRDNALVDRTTELRSVSQGSLIRADGLEWVVRDVVELTDDIRFTVAPQLSVLEGFHDFEFVNHPSSTFNYGQVTDWWNSNQVGSVTARGLLTTGAHSAVMPTMHALAVDAFFTESSVSPDWDMMSMTGGSGGGGGPHAHDDQYLKLSGGTMTGAITLQKEPVNPSDVVHREYVDTSLEPLWDSVDMLLGDLGYMGTYNALTHTISTVSAMGVTNGYVSGAPLPVSSAANAKHYFIVSKGGPTSIDDGIYTPDYALNPSYEMGDWIISNGGGTVLRRDGTQATVVPYLDEAPNSWVHLAYSSRYRLATSVVMDPPINGTSGQTAQALLAALASWQDGHAAALDPHPVYVTAAEANAAYVTITANNTAWGSHTNESSNPHDQYNQVHIGTTAPVSGYVKIWVDTS